MEINRERCKMRQTTGTCDSFKELMDDLYRVSMNYIINSDSGEIMNLCLKLMEGEKKLQSH